MQLVALPVTPINLCQHDCQLVMLVTANPGAIPCDLVAVPYLPARPSETLHVQQITAQRKQVVAAMERNVLTHLVGRLCLSSSSAGTLAACSHVSDGLTTVTHCRCMPVHCQVQLPCQPRLLRLLRDLLRHLRFLRFAACSTRAAQREPCNQATPCLRRTSVR